MLASALDEDYIQQLNASALCLANWLNTTCPDFYKKFTSNFSTSCVNFQKLSNNLEEYLSSSNSSNLIDPRLKIYIDNFVLNVTNELLISCTNFVYDAFISPTNLTLCTEQANHTTQILTTCVNNASQANLPPDVNYNSLNPLIIGVISCLLICNLCLFLSALSCITKETYPSIIKIFPANNSFRLNVELTAANPSFEHSNHTTENTSSEEGNPQNSVDLNTENLSNFFNINLNEPSPATENLTPPFLLHSRQARSLGINDNLALNPTHHVEENNQFNRLNARLL